MYATDGAPERHEAGLRQSRPYVFVYCERTHGGELRNLMESLRRARRDVDKAQRPLVVWERAVGAHKGPETQQVRERDDGSTMSEGGDRRQRRVHRVREIGEHAEFACHMSEFPACQRERFTVVLRKKLEDARDKRVRQGQETRRVCHCAARPRASADPGV